MDLICGVDFETTGLDPKENSIIEIGAALFTETFDVVKTFNCFIRDPIGQPLSPEIVKLTGVTDEMLATGHLLPDALNLFFQFSNGASVFLAHNAPFDRSFLDAALESQGMKDMRPWYCSKEDVPAHEGKGCKKLSHLAVDYGCVVDGKKLHRALDDVLLMGEMIRATGHAFSDIKAYADEPWVYLKAVVRYEQREEAKKFGFGWEKCLGSYTPIFPKTWVKKCKASKLEEEKSKQVPFKREVISPPV